MNDPLDVVLKEVAEANALEETIEDLESRNRHRLARLQREANAARQRSLFGRTHGPRCPSLQPGKSGACCNCGPDKTGREPAAQLNAMAKALERCYLCSAEHCALVLRGNDGVERGICRDCARGSDVHAEGCAIDGQLISCTCTVRGRLRSR